MNERNERVAAAVEAAGIEPAIRILDADAKTAAAAASQLGCDVGAIANSLVFSCGDQPLLIMASGGARVDVHLVAELLGCDEITKATPAFVRASTGQVIGGVAPVGHPEQIRTVVDESLAGYPVIWTAAGTADSVMPVTYDQLLTLTGGTSIRVR